MFQVIIGYLALASCGWELRKAGDERNWVRLFEALIIGIIGSFLTLK